MFVSLQNKFGVKAESTMNYGSPWGAVAEQVREKINFHFLKIVLNLKLELIDFTDLSPSPTPCSDFDPGFWTCDLEQFLYR